MKHSIEDFAILGGPATFQTPLHVGSPNMGDRSRLLQRINDILDRRWFTNHGEYVRQFEGRISELVGANHCIAICNGTIALEIAIRAAGLSGEIIVPSFTFVATAHAIQWQQIKPVFCDIDAATHTIDPRRVEQSIGPRTAGIIAVHTWGIVHAIDELSEIARRHNLSLIFDAAHALGCSFNGKMVGVFGDAEVFSFHATKFCNTFEGGAIVTNRDDLAEKARLLRNFGFSGLDNVVQIGINGKMDEVTAAMGLTSLEAMDNFIATNRRNYNRYRHNLQGITGIRMQTYDDREKSNYQYIVVELDPTAIGLSRDHLVQVLHAENVLARRYFYPGCHRMEPYRTLDATSGQNLPVTEQLVERVMVLPTGTAVTEDDIDQICDLIKYALSHGAEIVGALGQ